MSRTCRAWSYSLLLLAALLSGCGKRPVFNDHVEGIVKLDGKPLGNVHVQFVPNDPEMKVPGSTGMTDDNGHYELVLETPDRQPGAVVGKHLVVIVRGREAIRALGEKPAGDSGASTKKKDRRPIPSAYTMASQTPLKIEVTTDQHTYDLDLVTAH